MERDCLSSAQVLASLRYDPKLRDSKENNVTSVSGERRTPFYMIQRQHARILRTASFLGWKQTIAAVGTLEQFESALYEFVRENLGVLHQQQETATLKVRYTADSEGSVAATCATVDLCPIAFLYPSCFNDLPPMTSSGCGSKMSPVPPWWIVSISPRRISPGPHTTFKTTFRSVYDEARHHLPTEYDRKCYGGAEVLLVSTDGQVCEGSITTVYFQRRGKWVTPPSGESAGNWGGHTGTTREWALEKGLAEVARVYVASVTDGEHIWLSNGVRGFIRAVISL